MCMQLVIIVSYRGLQFISVVFKFDCIFVFLFVSQLCTQFFVDFIAIGFNLLLDMTFLVDVICLSFLSHDDL